MPIISTKRGIGTVGPRCSGSRGFAVDCEGDVGGMSLDELLMSPVRDGEMGSMLSSDAVVKLVLLVTCVLGEEFPVRAVSKESVEAECSVGSAMGCVGDG